MTNDFETVLCCFLIVCFAVAFYLAGKGNLLELAPRFLLDRLEELNRKHGEWIPCGDGEHTPLMCSSCLNTWAFYKQRGSVYCPNCGAKMDLKEGAEE